MCALSLEIPVYSQDSNLLLSMQGSGMLVCFLRERELNEKMYLMTSLKSK